MDRDIQGRTSLLARVSAGVRSHPVIASTLVVCVALGALLGIALLPEEWSMLRRLLGGAISGGGVALLMTFPKLFE